jgi:hypothetical protein
MITMPARELQHTGLTYAATNVIGSAGISTATGLLFQASTSAFATSQTQNRTNDTYANLNHGHLFANWTRRLEVGGWFAPTTPNAEGVFRAMYGKLASDAYGAVASGNYVGFQLSNLTITALYACKAGVLTTVVTSTVIPFSGAHIWCISENGTVTWYVNGVSIGATALGPTVTSAAGSITFEINNGATAAAYIVRFASYSKGY